MAEITTTNKKSIRVDMTPMVDLGFLLITFFVFTTTFNNPYVVKLIMPDNKGPKSNEKTDNTLTLILGKANRLFWHQKPFKEVTQGTLNETDYSAKGVRQVILDARKNALNPENFTIIIKPTDESNYQNTIDILDEMTITNNSRYALVDLTPKEKEVYKEKVK